MLWIVVSGLWTTATVLRMQRVWVTSSGWPALLDNPITWISLCVPPFMFAIILVTIKAITRTGHRPGG